MGAARRITISLPAETARAVDQAAMQRGCSRSALIQEALVWHLRVQTLPIEEPTPEERAALAAGRAQHTRGEFVTLDEVQRELAADLSRETPEEACEGYQLKTNVVWTARLAEMERDPLSGDVVVLKDYPIGYRRRVGPYRILFDVDTATRTVQVQDILRRTSTSYRRRR